MNKLKEEVVKKFGGYLVDNYTNEMLSNIKLFLMPIHCLKFLEDYFGDELEENFAEMYEQLFVMSLDMYKEKENERPSHNIIVGICRIPRSSDSI